MTYTFKLARRLAISQHLSMVSVLLLLAACASDTTGPAANDVSQPTNPSWRLVPRQVTVETNQTIRFRSQSPDGRRFTSALTWNSTGGAINPDGTFSASQPGTYKIVGRGRGKQKPDTSVVVVVPPQADVIAVQVSPDPLSLSTGDTHTFTAAGQLSDGTTAAIGVTWSATGGAIDAGGVYKAGTAAGKYRVVATKSSSTLADTAIVTITDPAPPAPAPTLAKVVLSPGSVSLAAGNGKQFTAYGRNSLGDSVPVQAAFTATGGTITSSGLYTAGSVGGTYRVIASASGLADTSVTTIAAVSTTTTGRVGIPFGPSQQLDRTGSVASPFTLTKDSYSPSNILSRIQAARAGGYKLLLSLASGPHRGTEDGSGPLLSVINGVLQFDYAKYRAQVDRYNTPDIRSAIEAAVRDGVIIGNQVMDEPYVSGGSDGLGNTWGPKGTMTKSRVDMLCGYVKNIFPTLPNGPEHQHQLFEPANSYRVCDFYIDQYKAAYGSVTTYRDAALAMAQRDGHAVLFGLNVLDGGVPDKDGTWDCIGAGQAGKGTYSPACRMTAAQVRDWGLILGPAGCGLYLWRHDADFIANADNQRAFKDLGAGLATAPWKSCARP